MFGSRGGNPALLCADFVSKVKPVNPSFDVIIIGAGPAGSTCGAVCARAGLHTLIIEKTRFPREKVCGDCINPGCWPVLERLGVAEQLLALPYSRIAMVEFIDRRGHSIEIPLPASPRGKIALKRSLLDQVLLNRAIQGGTDVIQGEVLHAITTTAEGWRLQAGPETYIAKTLVAADGRNSTVARLLGLAPALVRDRVALQTHIAAPAGFGEKIVLQQLDGGYCGLASLGGNELNVCLVGRPEGILDLKKWAGKTFAIAPRQDWRTITPLARAPLAAAHPNLLLVGDAARVVEPFTGEGIYYALASGELAAKHIVKEAGSGDSGFKAYRSEHAELYRGRLWINRLAKEAMVHPRLGDAILAGARWYPGLLRSLTTRVLQRS
jgi:geranylgeranyl reductase family protein